MATITHPLSPHPSVRILIVDDVAEMRELLTLSILRMGYEVEAASTLAQAMAKLRQQHYQLVLTELHLPDGLGIEMIRHLAKTAEPSRITTPVAVMVADGRLDDAMAALKAGAVDYVAKPIVLEQLKLLVHKVLGVATVAVLTQPQAMAQTGFNRRQAAKRLGLSEQPLHDRMQQLEMRAHQGTEAIDAQGWWAAAQRLPSPNFDVRPSGMSLDLIVLHNISLPPGEFGGGQIAQFFTNQLNSEAHPYFKTIAGVQVSAHFLITRLGACTQFVACQDRAWHAGLSNFMGRDRCNDFSIGIELEGTDIEPFTPAQYDTLLVLIRDLLRRYPTICALAGHSDIAPNRKTDPGPCFDWAGLAEQSGLAAHFFPYGLQNR